MTSSESGKPLRRVQIRVSAPGSTSRARSAPTARADTAARPPAGRYTIHVTRSGYLSLEFGQPARRSSARRPLPVAEAADDRQRRFRPAPHRRDLRARDRRSRRTHRRRRGWAFPVAVLSGPPTARADRLGANSDVTGHTRLVRAAPAPASTSFAASIRETSVMEGEEKQTLAFAPTYFPRGSNPAEAQRVRSTSVRRSRR